MMQIAAVGPQNKHITIDPDPAGYSTPFKSVYMTHVQCAFEQREIRHNRDVRFGERVKLHIPSDGDFIGEMWLEIELPVIKGNGDYKWVDFIGYAMIKQATLRVDDVVIHQYDKYLHAMLDQALTPSAKKEAKREMVGVGLIADRPHTVYVPLVFFHTRPKAGHGWLPMWALRKSVVAVELELEDISKLVLARTGDVYVRPTGVDDYYLQEIIVGTDGNGNDIVQEKPMKIEHGSFALLVQTAFVGREAKFFHLSDTRLVEQVQLFEGANTSESNVDTETFLDKCFVDIPFINNIKCILWTVQKKKDIDENIHFRYLDAINTVSIHLDGNQTDTRNHRYFRLYQPWCSGIGSIGNVHAFSFALDANSYQPTGVAFFSSFRSKRLRLEFKDAVFNEEVLDPDTGLPTGVTERQQFVIRTYGVTYNVFEAKNGIGRLTLS